MATTNAQALSKMLALKLPTFKPVEAVAAAIGKAQGKGLEVDDVFPFGIIIHDGYTFSGNLDPQDILKIGEVIASVGKVKGVEIFPRGITAPETLRMKVSLHK